MNANMSIEDREAKVKLLNRRENRMSMNSVPTHTHTHGQAPGQGLTSGLSKVVTFAAEGLGLGLASGSGQGQGSGGKDSGMISMEGGGGGDDGNELSEEDLRYLGGGRESAIDAAIALKGDD